MFASVKKVEEIELLDQEKQPDRPKTPQFVEKSYNINIEHENVLETNIDRLRKNQILIVKAIGQLKDC